MNTSIANASDSKSFMNLLMGRYRVSVRLVETATDKYLALASAGYLNTVLPPSKETVLVNVNSEGSEELAVSISRLLHFNRFDQAKALETF